ncbi:MAG: hypothetical protein KAR06_04970 [Deltaproteobacteria bacterium]|nr:hypothetical protein [Deltaproteobacteria bacterium]
MAEYKDDMGIQDKVHIVLRGPDGKIKDERKPEEGKNEAGKRPGTSQQVGD